MKTKWKSHPKTPHIFLEEWEILQIQQHVWGKNCLCFRSRYPLWLSRAWSTIEKDKLLTLSLTAWPELFHPSPKASCTWPAPERKGGARTARDPCTAKPADPAQRVHTHPGDVSGRGPVTMSQQKEKEAESLSRKKVCFWIITKEFGKISLRPI